MKKGVVVLIFFIALVVSVTAFPTGVPAPNVGVQRYTDFETDNVHILRLGNFSAAVVQEVSQLEKSINAMEEHLKTIQAQLDGLKTNAVQQKAEPVQDGGLEKITAQLVSIESAMNQLKNAKNNAVSDQSTSDNSWLVVLNIIVLMGVLGTVLMVRKSSGRDEKSDAEAHARMHLHNAVRNALKSGASVDSVRHGFVRQGWQGDWVDRAIEEGVKR